MKKRFLFAVSASVLITGCSSTGVTPMDQDSYLIGRKDRTPGLGVSLSNKAKVLQEANSFCKEKGLDVKILNITTIPSAPAQFGSTEVQFRCVPSGGSAETMVKVPDQVIEVRNR